MGASQGALGQKHPTGAFFRVGVGDIEPHASGARCAHLHVATRCGVLHTPVEDLDVPDEARNIERLQKLLGHLCVQIVTQDSVPGFLRRGEDVPVGDAGGGVDAVDDDIGPVLHEKAVESIAVEVAICEARDLGPYHFHSVGFFRQDEDVSAAGGERRLTGLDGQLLTGIFGLLGTEAVDEDLLGAMWNQLLAHGSAHQAETAEDQNFRTFDIHLPPPGQLRIEDTRRGRHGR